MRYYFPVPSQCVILKEYLKLFNRLYDITSFVGILRVINREVAYEKLKLYQTRLYKYNLFKNFNSSLYVIQFLQQHLIIPRF